MLLKDFSVEVCGVDDDKLVRRIRFLFDNSRHSGHAILPVIMRLFPRFMFPRYLTLFMKIGVSQIIFVCCCFWVMG